jgi:hypothetical protein
MSSFKPPFSDLSNLQTQIKEKGFVLLKPEDLLKLSQHSFKEWSSHFSSWNNLADDTYLKDGGRYRKRRHSSVTVLGDTISVISHRAHWQPLSYNALHGGIDRWFEPCSEHFLKSSEIQNLLKGLCHQFSEIKNVSINTPWFVEIHQFRIDTTNGIGRPTPEGAHRDGVDFVAVMLIDRANIKGGETRVFRNQSPEGKRFTLIESLSLLLIDDEEVIHETTPIQPIDQINKGFRDTLVLTFRLNGFLDNTIQE